MSKGSKIAAAAKRKADGQRKKENEKIAETKDQEFVDRVQTLLAGTYEGSGEIHGEVDDEAGRLAAGLAFLQVQAREYLDVQMNAYQGNSVVNPRVRAAAYAAAMITDLMNGQRHPMHRLCRAMKLDNNDIESSEFHRQAILIACAESLLEVQGKNRQALGSALKLMLNEPGIVCHVPEGSDAFKKKVQRKMYNPDTMTYGDRAMGRKVKEHRAFMRRHDRSTVKDILLWTSRVLWVHMSPLDLGAASAFERRRIMTVDPKAGLISLSPGQAPAAIAPPSDQS
ncbi:hypothetical protein AU375_04425 [Methylobacterium radiotolerans]|nr:hypothetical protein AU375_04425 [Methylobacterium radiotolerans]